MPASSEYVECNLDRDSLDDFGVVTRGIIRWQQRKLRSARRRDFDYFAAYNLAGIFVNPDLRRVANPDVRELELF